MNDAVLAFIKARSIPEPNTGCWFWLGSVNNWGYGRTRLAGSKERAAHRIAFTAKGRPIPAEAIVMHMCDQPSCVNPDHLRLGDTTMNMRDMVNKGRQANMRGERSPTAKLNRELVQRAKARHQAGDSVASIARDYGVSRRAIRFALGGVTWA